MAEALKETNPSYTKALKSTNKAKAEDAVAIFNDILKNKIKAPPGSANEDIIKDYLSAIALKDDIVTAQEAFNIIYQMASAKLIDAKQISKFSNHYHKVLSG